MTVGPPDPRTPRTPRTPTTRRVAAAAAALAGALAAAGLLAVPVASAQTQAAAEAVATAAAPATSTVTLINGARVVVTSAGPGGHVAAAATAAQDGPGGVMLRLALDGNAYEIPADALPYLNRGLSPALFELNSLVTEESGGLLPVQVSYRGRLPALPGVRITRSGDGSALGYLTAASAATFGAALARQFAADHARGSYGTDGIFAGGVSIGLPGQAAVTPARPDYPMYTLTVAGTDLAGAPDTGDAVSVYNVDSLLKFGDPIETSNFFYHGVAKFSVPAGHYMAEGLFFDASGALRVVMLPQFTVTGDTTVAVSEQTATNEVQMLTPRPAVVRDISFTATRTTADDDLIVNGVDAGNMPLWTNQTTVPVTVGTLHTTTTGYLTSPAGGPLYEYDLAFAGPSGLIGPQQYTVTAGNVAAVTARFFQDGRSVGGWAPDALFSFAVVGGVTIQFNDVFPFGLPRAEIQYFSAGPSLYWMNQYWQSYSILSGGQTDAPRAFAPGEVTSEDWNEGPLHPAPDVNVAGPGNPLPTLPSASRFGNTLMLDITPFSDNTPGHAGTGYSFPLFSGTGTVSGRYRLDQNGRQISAGNAAAPGLSALILLANVSGKPATMRFLLTAARTGRDSLLSPSSRTVWTWRTARTPGRLPAGWLCGNLTRFCAVQPLITLLYQVRGLGLDDVAPTGRQLVQVTVGHLPLAPAAAVTGLTAAVSVNDGRTWRVVPVRQAGLDRFDVTFNAPSGAYVSLRVRAADAAGGQITETIIRGYQIAA